MRHYMTALGLALLLSSCESDTTVPGPTGDLITLNAQQAALIAGRIVEFSSDDPTLSALADTIQFVVKSGAEVQRIDVTTSFGVTSYWTVSLHRTHSGPSQSWSTFHVIGFDDPSDPTEFLILGGFSQVAGTTAPTSISGSIGSNASSSLTGHFFGVIGDQVGMWNASGGTVSMTATSTAGACPNFTAQGMTCAKSSMATTFSITQTVTGGAPATGQRTGSASDATVPGVRLSM
jgi:hypothetical protein